MAKKTKKIRDLMTDESRSNPDIEGFLTKEGGRIKTWKRRFFILKENKMTYLRDKGDLYCKGKFELEPSSSVVLISPREFCIITSKRSYPILADTPQDAKNWCDALNRSLEKLRGNKIIYVPTNTATITTSVPISTSPGQQIQQPPQQFSYVPFINGLNSSTNNANTYNTLTKSINNNNIILNNNNNNNNNNNINNSDNNSNNNSTNTTPNGTLRVSTTTPKKQQTQIGWHLNLPSGVSFLNDQNAQIQVRIINGRNLLGAHGGDHLDERDPYVKIRTSGSSGQFLAQTSIVECSLNPRWDESFIVPIENVLTDMVIIEVHDHRSKEFLGFVGIDVFYLPFGTEVLTSEQLSFVLHGDIQLGITALNFGVQFYTQPSYLMQYISWRQSLPGTSKNGASKLKEIGISDKKNRLRVSAKQDGPYSKKNVIKDYEIRGGWLKLSKEFLYSIYSKQIAHMNQLARSTSSTNSTTSNNSESVNNSNGEGEDIKRISFINYIQLQSESNNIKNNNNNNINNNNLLTNNNNNTQNNNSNFEESTSISTDNQNNNIEEELPNINLVTIANEGSSISSSSNIEEPLKTSVTPAELLDNILQDI